MPDKIPIHDGPLTSAEREELRKQARHYVHFSRVKAVFIGFCFLAIIVSFIYQRSEVNNARNVVYNEVTRLESPCLKYGSESRRCELAFGAAVAGINERGACFIVRKSGLARATRDAFSRAGIRYVDPCQSVGPPLAASRRRDGGAQDGGPSTKTRQPEPQRGRDPQVQEHGQDDNNGNGNDGRPGGDGRGHGPAPEPAGPQRTEQQPGGRPAVERGQGQQDEAGAPAAGQNAPSVASVGIDVPVFPAEACVEAPGAADVGVNCHR